jgi:hypothetical protein
MIQNDVQLEPRAEERRAQRKERRDGVCVLQWGITMIVGRQGEMQ